MIPAQLPKKETRDVVLLHGFPDFASSWDDVATLLRQRGYQVLTPELYPSTNVKHGRYTYSMRSAATRLARTLDEVGIDSAHVVGHDWGGVLAWSFAMAFPARTASLSLLNAPHPRAFGQHLSSRQGRYALAFQLPYLPELLLARREYRALIAPMRHLLREGEQQRFLQRYKEKGTMHAMLGLYRAMLLPWARVPEREVQAPTLVLWGDQDPYLHRDLATPPHDAAARLQTRHLRGVGHWPQRQAPEDVSAALLQFWTRHERAPS